MPVAHQCSGGTRIGAVLFVCGSGLPSGVDASIGPLNVHGAVAEPGVRNAGVALPPTHLVSV
jgi:hypothetical protein